MEIVMNTKRRERLIKGFILTVGFVTATIFFVVVRLIQGDLIPVHAIPTNEGLKIGTRLPNLSLPDLTGKMVSLENLKGRKTLLVLSDPDCGNCKQLYPILRSLAKEYKGKVNIVIISSGTDSMNKQIAKEYKITSPLLRGERKAVFEEEFKVRGVPFIYLMDRNGMIRDSLVGFFPRLKEALKDLIEELDQNLIPKEKGGLRK